MHSSLLEILRTFNPKELKKFEDFVCSPYFNKKSGVIHLYKHIKKYAPEFKSPTLEMEKVWKVIYPNRKYNYGIFKNLISDLRKTLDVFIMMESFQKDTSQKDYYLLSGLYEKENKKLFSKQFDTLKNKMNNLQENISAEELHYNMSKIYSMKITFDMFLNKHFPDADDVDNHTISQFSTLLISIINMYSNVLVFSRDHNYNKEENIIVSFLKNKDIDNSIYDLIESLKPKSIVVYKILNAFYKYYQSISDNVSVTKYFDFKEALMLNASSFSKHDKFFLYSCLFNCLAFLNSMEINKSKERLDIIKLQIRDEVVLDPNGLISDVYFIDTIQAACNLGDDEFIEEFTTKFIKHIPKDTRQNMLKYSLAHLYFTRSEYEKSLEEISTLHYDSLGMKYYLKNLDMMNYYELHDYNSFLLLLDSYKHLLSENKSIPEGWKNSQNLFNNFLNKLFKLNEKFDEYKLENLKCEVTKQSFTKKQWLQKKISELDSKASHKA